MSDDFYVYILFRLDGRPFYVGKGRKARVHEHQSRAVRGRSYKDNIICKILEAGEGVPFIKIAEGLSESAAYAKEIELISSLGRRPYGPLVNKTGGGGNAVPGALTRRKMSLAKKGRKQTPEHIAARFVSRAGWRHSAESRAKMSATRKGRKCSEETLERLRNNYKLREVTPEYRRKMSLAAIARWVKRRATTSQLQS